MSGIRGPLVTEPANNANAAADVYKQGFGIATTPLWLARDLSRSLHYTSGICPTNCRLLFAREHNTKPPSWQTVARSQQLFLFLCLFLFELGTWNSKLRSRISEPRRPVQQEAVKYFASLRVGAGREFLLLPAWL